MHVFTSKRDADSHSSDDERSGRVWHLSGVDEALHARPRRHQHQQHTRRRLSLVARRTCTAAAAKPHSKVTCDDGMSPSISRGMLRYGLWVRRETKSLHDNNSQSQMHAYVVGV